jgi:hypothetical protein
MTLLEFAIARTFSRFVTAGYLSLMQHPKPRLE